MAIFSNLSNFSPFGDLKDKLVKSITDKVGEILAEKLEELWPILVNKILALLPVLGASVASSVAGLGEKAADQVIEEVRENLNSIPDIDIPVVSDIFDLTEFLKKLGK